MGNHGNCAGISQLRFLFTHMLPELAQLEACGFFKAIVTRQVDYIGVYRLPEVACGQGYIAHRGNLCCRNLGIGALTTGHQYQPRLQVCQQLLVRFFQAAGVWQFGPKISQVVRQPLLRNGQDLIFQPQLQQRVQGTVVVADHGRAGNRSGGCTARECKACQGSGQGEFQ